MAHFQKLKSSKIIFLHDLLMIPAAWFGAYWLRFNLGDIPENHLTAAVNHSLLVVITQALVFRFFGLYRGVWRFASLPDLLRIIKATVIGTLIVATSIFLYDRLAGVPRSVIPLYGILLLLLLCTPRFLYRYWKDNMSGNRLGKRAIIVGAGMAGEMLVRDLLRESNSEFCPVAFVDDDTTKRRREIHGLRVLGACRKLPKLVKQLNAEFILIAIPSASNFQMRRIVPFCEESQIPFLTLPSLKDHITSRVTRQELRHVSIEDLLGRDPVRLNRDLIRRHLQGTRVMVTGGGGSIGSELCKQIASMPIKELVIFEKSEFNLYRIEAYLSRLSANLIVHAVLGDVTDRIAVNHTVMRHEPDIIFHTASYKHVPMLQNQVRAAVRNNVIGTNNVVQAARIHGVGKFVLISTDKAVNPTNVMGATKRAAEVLCRCEKQGSRTKFMTVRFGNVLDSAGSVVPLFRDQIKSGGPVTVTHPEVMRYFMTTQEACQLIMQAASLGDGGDLFVLDMGEPIKIAYLAELMIRLSEKTPGDTINIEYTGLRPGEKMHEELFHENEKLEATVHKKLFLSRPHSSGPSSVSQTIEDIEKACLSYDEDKILGLLREMVPEFSDSDSDNGKIVYLDRSGKNRIEAHLK